MGVIGLNNQPLRGRGGVSSQLYADEDNEPSWTDSVFVSRKEVEKENPNEDPSTIAEALSQFRQPKDLLFRIIQVATSSTRVKVGSSLPFAPWKLGCWLVMYSNLQSLCILTGADAVQNNRKAAEEVSADAALAGGDDVHRHGGHIEDSREESCSSCLHETEGEDITL